MELKGPDLDREMSELYRLVITKCCANWPLGAYERMEGKDPILSKEIGRAIEDLEQTWLKVREGKAGITDFKICLQKWGESHLKVKNQNAGGKG